MLVSERIELSNVGFGYRKSVAVLDGLSLQFLPGVTVLLGPNGAGKSTLLALAAGALRPKQGSIALRREHRVIEPTDSTYRKSVGWLPQTIGVVPGLTVSEQVAYAGWLGGLGRRAAWAGAGEALAAVGLSSLSGRKARALSGGETRRMGVASVLTQGADWLLMDEPMAGLDPAERIRLLGVLRTVALGASLVISTHQTDWLMGFSDSVMVIAAGRLLWEGPTSDYLNLAPRDTPDSERADWVFTHMVDYEE